MKALKSPSPAMLVALVALIVALGGTAVAGGVLNKKKVNKIITNRAPGLSVNHANTAGSAANADSATKADTATSAASVGGVSIQPLSLSLVDGPSFATPIDVSGSQVNVTCLSGGVQLEIDRGVSGPPISGQWIRNGLTPLVAHPPPGGGFSSGTLGVQGFTATIRESSGRVTRLIADSFYEANAYGGPEDCFVQGTIERFG